MKIYFETLGCPKNFNDTQFAKAYLKESGHTFVDFPEDSDVMILNTCGFINDAKKESIDRTFELAAYKDDSSKKLVMTGCLSERYSNELFEEIPEVDLFIGVNEYSKLSDLLDRLNSTNSRCKDVSGKVNPCFDKIPREFDSRPYTATLKIAEGCNNHCAYCVIPEIRGAFRSKPIEDIIEEAEYLAKEGTKELILIAQDVTIYGKDIYGEQKLPELLKELVKIDGIEWIRLMYCYEDRITDELISVMSEEPKICHYIDIPIQHASNNILKAMNRRSTEESIKLTITKLRNSIPDIHIRTTLITGFPGETEEDFEKLLDFVEEERFARLGVFAYSQEEGTPAGEMDDQIPEDAKQARLDALMRRQLDISFEYNKSKIGKVLNVIVDEKDEDGSYVGRTEYDAPEIDNSVLFTSRRELKPGDMVKVLINDAFDYDLVGIEL